MLVGIFLGLGIVSWTCAHFLFQTGYGYVVSYDVHEEYDAEGEPFTCCSVFPASIRC